MNEFREQQHTTIRLYILYQKVYVQTQQYQKSAKE